MTYCDDCIHFRIAVDIIYLFKSYTDEKKSHFWENVLMKAISQKTFLVEGKDEVINDDSFGKTGGKATICILSR